MMMKGFGFKSVTTVECKHLGSLLTFIKKSIFLNNLDTF